MIGDCLDDLDRKWRSEGKGINLRGFRGSDLAFANFGEHHACLLKTLQDVQDIFCSDFGFLDDIYLVADTLSEAQLMLVDVTCALSCLGLSLNPDRIKWVANSHAEVNEDDHLLVDYVKIARADYFVCLGSVISRDLKEAPAFEHRISRAWSCYHKWSTVLESRAPLDARL